MILTQVDRKVLGWANRKLSWRPRVQDRELAQATAPLNAGFGSTPGGVPAFALALSLVSFRYYQGL